MEEVSAGKVGVSLLTRIARSLCGARCTPCTRRKDRRKKAKRAERKCLRFVRRCCCCCRRAGLPDETDTSVVEKHLEYKDRSTSYNILCCSTNVRSNDFEFDMELYNRDSRYADGASMIDRVAKRETTV